MSVSVAIPVTISLSHSGDQSPASPNTTTTITTILNRTLPHDSPIRGDAIACLLSLGTTNTCTPTSPTKTPSPQSVAALEKRMSGHTGNGGRFEFGKIDAKENMIQSANKPPRESAYKTNINAQKRSLSIPRASSAGSIPSSLALALQSTSPAALTRVSLASLTPKSPPRKIVPTLIRDADKLPTPHELSLDSAQATPAENTSPIIGESVDELLQQRSVSLTSYQPCLTPEDAAKTLSQNNAYLGQLLRTRSAGAASHIGTVSNASQQITSRSSSITSASTRAHRTTSSGSVIARSQSSGGSNISSCQVRVSIKPLGEIKSKATSVLNEARTNNKLIRTYTFS